MQSESHQGHCSVKEDGLYQKLGGAQHSIIGGKVELTDTVTHGQAEVNS